MKLLIFFGLALSSFISFAQAPTPSATKIAAGSGSQPAAAAVLAKTARLYESMKTFRIQEIKQQTDKSERETQKQVFQFNLMRSKDGRYKFAFDDPAGSWNEAFDGKTETLYWEQGHAVDAHAHEGDPSSPSAFFAGSEWLNEDEATKSSFIARMTSNMSEAKFLPDESITLKGIRYNCFVIEGRSREACKSERFERTFWIDKKTGFLRKEAEVNRTFLDQSDRTVRDTQIITRTYPVIETPKQIDAANFTLKVPPHANSLRDIFRAITGAVPNLIGTDVPDILLAENDGLKKSLKDYRGQVVLIDFWATWCGPCREELPDLWKIVKSHANTDLVTVMIDHDKDAREAQQYLAGKQMALNDVHADESIDQKFNVNSFPTTVVVGKDGKIVFYESGYGTSTRSKLVEAIDDALEASPDSFAVAAAEPY